MFLCKECGGLFETPKCTVEHLEHFGCPCAREEYCSPCCSADYIPAQACKICGDWICGEYIELVNGEMVCDSCYVRKDICDI